MRSVGSGEPQQPSPAPGRGLRFLTTPGRRLAVASALAFTLAVAGQTPASAEPVAVPQPSTVCVTAPPVAPAVVAASGNATGVYGGVLLTGTQVDAAATIVNVGLDAGVSRRGIATAVAAAMAASSLDPTARNRSYVGLFQQRTDARSGLYTAEDRLDPVGSAKMFFAELVARVPGYDTDPRSNAVVGEEVQESGDAGLASRWAGLADGLVDHFIPVEAPVAAEAPAAPEVAAVVTPAVATVGSTGHRGLTVAMPLRTAGLAFAAPSTTADVTTPTTAGTTAVSGSTSSRASGATAGSTSAAGDEPATTAGTTPGAPTTTGSGASAPTTGSTDGSTTTAPTTTGPTTTAPAEPTGTESTTTGTEPTTTGPAEPTGTEPTTTAPAEPTTTEPTTTAPAEPTTTEPTTTEPTTTEPTTTAPAEPTPATAPATETAPPAAEPEVVEPPVVDTPREPDTAPEPVRATDTVGQAPGRTAVLDCGPDNNGGSTAFDPGFIVSDEVFYDTQAMTAEQIQAFLDAQGAACEGPSCVKNLRVTTPDLPADRYCAAYTGGTDELASAVLARASVACGINPQVMLVTLQKESALVTRTSPTPASYNAAWGWHCPDTGPGGTANCDPAHAGFFNQLYGMAKQWSRYKVDPDKYHYQAGETANILWNVAETGCGGSDVTIRNTATASLYNYTPYQPNAAALASYPGVGDRCSAYGNRNFFFLFQKYFGVTGGGVSATVSVNGVQVTIPNLPTVAPEVRGAVITAPNENVARGIAAGFASIGLPYVWGGGTNGGQADQGCSRGGTAKNSCAGTVGFDCSGLTAYVLTTAGFAVGTNSGSQRAGGRSVPWSAGQAGDIIGYSGHVAVYLGKINGVDYLLEAPNVGKYVQIRPVYGRTSGSSADAVLHRYWS
ncbi:C40 family peptidase [Nakamurella deserti]|uniref:C40 family peptidase n=1 Tax=Nakamurella deserti TaxID=2164074 RepID=UPI001300384A|nr:NlpC/P60 family protein [Nakamurella deserti]